MARASLVSINSDSMFAISTTMSSIAHSSYRTGRTFGGAVSGLARLGSPCAELDASSMIDPGPCEFRRLLGERGCGALSMGGSSTRVGVEGAATEAVALLSGSPWVFDVAREGCEDCEEASVGAEEALGWAGAFVRGEEDFVVVLRGAK